mgnify:CR=1 FL=1
MTTTIRSPPTESHDLPAGTTVVPPPFEQIYTDCFAYVWRALRRLGVPESGLDDAIQDVFITVHKNLPRFEGRSTVRSWVFGVAVNVARHHRRAHRRVEHDPLPETLVAGMPEPHGALARAEALRLLDALRDALDDDRRAVFVLSDYVGMSAPEIAASLGVNVNTVYTRLRAARADFEAALARHQRRSR